MNKSSIHTIFGRAIVFAAVTLMALTSVGLCDEDKALSAYDEPITLSIIYETDVGTQFLGGDTISDNVVTRFFQEKLNLIFDLDWQVDSGAYSQQLDLAIASNSELPDLFMANKQQLYTMASAGMILDMTEIYNEYASDNLKQVLGFNDNEGIESGSINGRLYGLPLTNDVGDGASLIFIRQDWLDKLDLEVPHTLSELIGAAQAFVDNNISGRKSTMGISMASDLGFTWDVIANAYGAYPDLWIEDENGNLVYGSVQEEIRGALEAAHELYEKGLIHKEFAAQDTSKLGQYVAQGRLGILIGPFWYNNLYILSNFKADKNAQWTVVNNLALNEGDTVNSRAWNTTYRWLAVSADCKHPEAVVKAMNLWYEIWQGEYADWFWGIQQSGHYYEIDLKEYSPIFFDPPLKNCQQGVALREAVATGNTDALNPEEQYNYSQLILRDNSALFRSAQLCWFGSFKFLNDTYDSFIYTKYRGQEDVMFNALQSTLDDLEQRMFIDIIMNGDISRFDDFVNQWYGEGGEYLTSIVNAWYQVEGR